MRSKVSITPQVVPRWTTSLDNANVEDIYRRALDSARGCTDTVSMKAPALVTEFTRSAYASKAHPGKPGAIVEITYPSDAKIRDRLSRKHQKQNLFGFRTAAAADAFPAGYGERSARSTVKESNVYQLKGTFPSALTALSKLQARVEARQGDVASVNRIFARMWGLSESQVEGMPRLILDGSEATRLSAMEDRAYHALSCHPAYSGGFRVDMASMTTDALGENVPISWQRIRNGVKTVAQMQMQGDLDFYSSMTTVLDTNDLTWTLDIVQDSQPKYTRSYPWEYTLDKLMATDDGIGMPIVSFQNAPDHPISFMQDSHDHFNATILSNPSLRIHRSVTRVANLVSDMAIKSLDRTAEVIAIYDRDRALLETELEDEFDQHSDSHMTRTFDIPGYKVTKNTMRNVLSRERVSRDNLPDLRSHGQLPLRLSHAEFRASGLTVPVDIPGALHMAVYMTSVKASMAYVACQLLSTIKDPDPSCTGPISSRLRRQELYAREEVYSIGNRLFDEEFMGMFEVIAANVSEKLDTNVNGIRGEIWDYLTTRGSKIVKCPVRGGWRDLIRYLRQNPEGWRLYYWARVSVGRIHHAMSSEILAPITDGAEVDFLSMVRKGIIERAKRWKAFYQEKYKRSLEDLEMKRARIVPKPPDDEIESTSLYIPPHARRMADLDDHYPEVHASGGLASQKEYEYMVEMQVKAKFFDKMEALTFQRKLSVGIPDSVAYEMLVEFYQARWYSMHKRIQRLSKLGKPLRLGGVEFWKHPWGDLVTELPGDVDGMMTFSMSLDQQAWTLNPGYVWEKLQKSVGELWNDIDGEIQRVTAYIEDRHDVLADLQATELAKSRTSNLTIALAAVPAIPLPAVGYRAPYLLPERQIEIQSDEAVRQVPSGSQPFIAESLRVDDSPQLPTDDDFELPNCDDDEGMMMSIMMLPSSKIYDTLELQPLTRYLSLNEIWEALGYGPEPDDVKRVTLGVAYDVDLDDAHVDSDVAPVVVYEELNKVRKIWASRVSFMDKRLGIAQRGAATDDM